MKALFVFWLVAAAQVPILGFGSTLAQSFPDDDGSGSFSAVPGSELNSPDANPARCVRTSYSPKEIADAIKSSSKAPNDIKDRSCTWGGAGRAESGGNLCNHNGGNWGVLQLSTRNVQRLGLTTTEYLNSSLQEQVDGWSLVGVSSTTQGFASINDRIDRSVRFGHLMDGPLAACSQFGAVICNNDVKLVESGKPVPIKNGAGAIPCTDAATCNRGTANQDGNGESIISWGLHIESIITQSMCVD